MNTERPENPESPEEPEDTAVPPAADAGTSPETSKVPEAAETPEAPHVAEAPETPEAAEAPEVSGTPEASGTTGPAGADLPGAARPADGGGAGSAGEDRADGPSGRRRSPLVVASVAAAVLLAGGGGAYLAAADGQGGGRTAPGAAGAGATPPPLALDGVPRGGTGGIAPGEPDPSGVTYTAAGKLPDGPRTAPVYAPGHAVGKAAVARLAKALGLTDAPVADGGGWRVGRGGDPSGPVLRVSGDAQGSWTYSRYAPGTDDCRKIVVCAQDPGAPAAEPVSEAAALRTAAPVLKALGEDDAKTDASQVMGARRVVDADPVVGGLPTYGWTTGLTVDVQGEIVGGHGLLAAPAEGATYPVLDARRTLDRMNAAAEPAEPDGHRMGIGGCPSPVAPKDRLERPCGRSAPAPGAGTGGGRNSVTVDKAEFGLASYGVAGRRTLVPSWLFQVHGTAARGAFTVTWPAVDPAYLAPPSAGSPSAVSPAPEPTSGTTTRDVRAEVWTADGRNLSVGFTGGVCATYSVSAKESADRVTVRVTERSRPHTVCVAMARSYVHTVRLDTALAGRKVTGTDGRPVPEGRPGVPAGGAR
ncbi:hypothetical protein ACIPRD_20325 [Streptomyces sp. NPDC090108]|uniref:hypothetical protein n=1 Tax=Streptomyces sp. NPDC090108 TaxID=3365947 RepID=UPI003816CC84